jgi:hypothetical protein
MKPNIIPAMLLVPLLLVGATNQVVANFDAPANEQSSALLAGSVTKGPLSPVERADQPRPYLGVAGARIDIADVHGKQLTSVVTDAGGNFKLSLPPGTYTLTMLSLHGAMFARDLPATVTITAGAVKRVDIHLDTGIR